MLIKLIMGHTGFPLQHIPMVILMLPFLLQVSFDKEKSTNVLSNFAMLCHADFQYFAILQTVSIIAGLQLQLPLRFEK
jgi:hypothetical protein